MNTVPGGDKDTVRCCGLVCSTATLMTASVFFSPAKAERLKT